jgi:hypothetical protein
LYVRDVSWRDVGCQLQHSTGYPGIYVIDEVQGSRLIVKTS